MWKAARNSRGPLNRTSLLLRRGPQAFRHDGRMLAAGAAATATSLWLLWNQTEEENQVNVLQQHQHAQQNNNDDDDNDNINTTKITTTNTPSPSLPFPLFLLNQQPLSNYSHCETAGFMSPPHQASTPPPASLNRHSTVYQITSHSTKASLESQYDVDWNKPLGEGAFGAVYLATHRATGEKVALKKISKRFTDDLAFQREMNALLHLQKAGGHPNICSLREHFDEGQHYYVVLDLISGGEMFDHLVSNGAFSEHDASRLVREVASALAFVHGLHVVHGDLKPENLMLSTDKPTDAVIKLVDFGCAQVTDPDDVDLADLPPMSAGSSNTGRTPAYCPHEVLDKRNRDKPIQPSMDMWALGVILYVMLTGVHPYDLRGNATDQEIERAVLSKRTPPLRRSRITAHLSRDAILLIEKLLQTNPDRRITALEMLEDPWVKGETASKSKIADSDVKLSKYRVFKSTLGAKVFADIVNWSDMDDIDEISKRTSLIERSFRELDPCDDGYIDLRKLNSKGNKGKGEESEPAPVSLAGFSDLLAENMKNKYFPTGHTVYHEGDVGNHMYFINSGVVEVVTKDGSSTTRGPGNFFGEGALLHPKKIRSGTIRCKTPVHAMEISRDYFEKYLAESDTGLLLTLKEKDKIRKRNRAKTILRLQKNLVKREFKKGQRLFTAGEEGDALFLIEKGLVDVNAGRKRVFISKPGNVCGEHALLMGRPRNSTAICASKEGCVVHEMKGRDFRKLMDASPEIHESLYDLCLRRDFKKAVVLRLRKEFPYDNPRKAFDAVRTDKNSDELDREAISAVMRELDPLYTDEEISDVIKTMDLSNSGKVTFDEFKKVFIANIQTASAM